MENVKFFYAKKYVMQLGFDGRNESVETTVGDGHIVYQGSFLCGTDKEKVKRATMAKSTSMRSTRLHNVPICAECEKRYKSNPRFAWKKWELLNG